MTVGQLRRDADTAEYLDGTARGQLLLRSCAECGAASEPQTRQCWQCDAVDLGWKEAAGDGVLISWAISHDRSDTRSAAQTVFGIVELAEGPWLWAQILADREVLGADLRLRVEFRRLADGSEAIPVFVTARDGAVTHHSQRVYRHQGLASRSGRLFVVVLREPDRTGVLLCDGKPLIATAPLRCNAPSTPEDHGEIRPGDWFVDPHSGLTVICPLGGTGILAFDGRRLQLAASTHLWTAPAGCRLPVDNTFGGFTREPRGCDAPTSLSG